VSKLVKVTEIWLRDDGTRDTWPMWIDPDMVGKASVYGAHDDICILYLGPLGSLHVEGRPDDVAAELNRARSR
jgi:hypothetical protein